MDPQRISDVYRVRWIGDDSSDFAWYTSPYQWSRSVRWTPDWLACGDHPTYGKR